MENGSDDYWADACIEMTVDLSHQTSHLDFFFPYTGGCPGLKPTEYFKFVDIICRGLKLKHISIIDAASVFICRNTPRLRTLPMGFDDFSVKVSALRFLNFKPAYYEQFGYVPDDVGRRFMYNKQLDGPANAPTHVLIFSELIKLRNPSLRHILKECLHRLSINCDDVEIKTWVCAKLHSLDIPIAYTKKMFV